MGSARVCSAQILKSKKVTCTTLTVRRKRMNNTDLKIMHFAPEFLPDTVLQNKRQLLVLICKQWIQTGTRGKSFFRPNYSRKWWICESNSTDTRSSEPTYAIQMQIIWKIFFHLCFSSCCLEYKCSCKAILPAKLLRLFDYKC